MNHLLQADKIVMSQPLDVTTNNIVIETKVKQP